MKKHGYRSRKEQDKELAKKMRDAGEDQMFRGPSEVTSLHGSFYDDLKVQVTYPSLSHLGLLPEQADGYFKAGDETFQWEFKTAADRSALLHVSPPCKPFFDHESIYRPAMGGKSATALPLADAMLRDGVVRDMVVLTHRRDLHRQRMAEHLFRPMFSKFMSTLHLGEGVDFEKDLLTSKRPFIEHDNKSADEILAELMETIATLPPKPKIDRHSLMPYQQELLAKWDLERPPMSDVIWHTPRRTGMSSLFAARYGQRAWYKLNRLTHKLHTLQGDYRPHKVSFAPEEIE